MAGTWPFDVEPEDPGIVAAIEALLPARG